ncbi:MAG: hypothetical protein L0H59_03175 [Tomitella sp.]|nr:hypothetical protein [Tomitella sp.]
MIAMTEVVDVADRKSGTDGWTPGTRQRAAKVLIRLNEDLGREITPRVRWIADGGEIRALREKKRAAAERKAEAAHAAEAQGGRAAAG